MQNTTVSITSVKMKVPFTCYQFQYSCLENPMDREAWQATVHGIIKESDTTEHTHTHTHTHTHVYILVHSTV